MLLRRMKRGDITVHGFRSTFRDWAADATNHPREVAEAALAHILENKVEAAYRRSELLAKRASLMEDWGRFCAEPVVRQAEVVTLQAVRT
jgi:integrase